MLPFPTDRSDHDRREGLVVTPSIHHGTLSVRSRQYTGPVTESYLDSHWANTLIAVRSRRVVRTAFTRLNDCQGAPTQGVPDGPK
jgi:hypothetical protein